MKRRLFPFLLCSLSLLTACIENDVPYPVIVGEITDISVEGMVSRRIISSSNEVIISVADTIDIQDVRIDKLMVTEGMTIKPDSSACFDYPNFPTSGFESIDELSSNHNTHIDFTKPVHFRLSLYQDYDWTVSVSRALNRIVKVQNQLGSALVDDYTHNVIIYVDSTAQPSLNNILIEKIQLGGAQSTITPDPNLVTDFTRPRIFHVTEFGETTEWTISVQYPNANVQLNQVAAWTRRAYIKGSISNGDVDAEYRKAGEEEWSSVLSNDITREGDEYLIKITHLEPSTTYEYRLTLNGVTGSIQTFTTDDIMNVPNLNFDTWVKDGRVWYPNYTTDLVDHFWDTGNEGTDIVQIMGTQPETGDVVKGTAVRMASAYISMASKFAAGNIYTGDFDKYNLSNLQNAGAELEFGQPYTGRPSGLKGYYKYSPGKIDCADAVYKDLIGRNDTAHIYFGLFDWTAPFHVNTTNGTFVDLTWNNESMIAFGEMKTGDATPGTDYKPFKINLNYRDYFTRPTYILIVATASKYGDYFTGSTSSVMYLDECELIFE